MRYPRTLLLFDPHAQPGSWNERMLQGEYAVHTSHLAGSAEPSCTVFGSLSEAETYAKAMVALRPELRCRIYDAQGFVGAPVLEFRGQQYKGESEISPRFRRWVGSILLFGGLALLLLDWSVDFKLSWPAMLGARMLIPGLVLLVTEVVIVLTVRREQRQDTTRKPA